MKGKQLAILALLAIILGTLALWSARREAHRTTPAQMGKKVLPDLQDKLNDVNAIVVRSPAGTATLARVDGTWRVAGKYNYPADFSKVRDLLTKLANLKIIQVMRASPNLLTDLQLAKPSASGDPQATLIELQDKSGKSLALLRMGKPRMRSAPTEEMSPYGSFPDGRFVATDNDRVYLVGDALNELVATDKDWLDRELINVNNNDLMAITVAGATSGVARLDRPSPGGEWTLSDIPQGKTIDTSKVNGLASALSFLRFEDLADPKLTPEQTGLDKPVTFQGKTRKGELYTVRIGKAPEGDTQHYAAFNVAFEAPPEPPSAAGTNQVSAAKTQAGEQAKTAAEVRRLNEKLSPWIYLLNSYQVEALTKGHADLVNDTQEEKKASKPETP